MEIQTLADLKLLHRAINGGWNVSDEMKKKSLANTAKLTEHPDPKIALLATKVLIIADSSDDKKALAEQKRQEAEHARKLQLLELAIKHGLVADVGSGVRALDSSTSTVTE
jgi:uncharacterized membrane protein